MIENLAPVPGPATDRLQQAIDRIHAAGGGVLRLLPGVHLAGTLRLRSRLTLEITPGATLKALEQAEVFAAIQSSVPSRMDIGPWKAFLHADGQHDIRVCGGGVIDGSGGARCFYTGKSDSPERPYGLHFIDCRRVEVENLTLRDSAFWMQRYFACDHVRVRGLTVHNHANLNNDGIDIDSSQNVIVSDCHFDVSDDAICLKSESLRTTRNVTVTNCVISSHASAFKLGTGSLGGFENITVSNLVIRRSQSTHMMHELGRWGGLTGIDMSTTDGGPLRSVVISNITVEDVECPVFLRLGNRLSGSIRKQGFSPAETTKSTSGGAAAANGAALHVVSPVFVYEDVTISGVVARNVGPWPVIVAGHEGQPIRRVTLRDITIVSGRAGTVADLESAPNWKANGYPLYLMLGERATPAHGLLTAFVEDLVVENFRAVPAPGEVRPARHDHR